MADLTRFAALAGFPAGTKIRPNNVTRVCGIGMWDNSEVTRFLQENCTMVAEPRWPGDCLGDAGCYDAAEVHAALVRHAEAGTLPEVFTIAPRLALRNIQPTPSG